MAGNETDPHDTIYTRGADVTMPVPNTISGMGDVFQVWYDHGRDRTYYRASGVTELGDMVWSEGIVPAEELVAAYMEEHPPLEERPPEEPPPEEPAPEQEPAPE